MLSDTIESFGRLDFAAALFRKRKLNSTIPNKTPASNNSRPQPKKKVKKGNNALSGASQAALAQHAERAASELKSKPKHCQAASLKQHSQDAKGQEGKQRTQTKEQGHALQHVAPKLKAVDTGKHGSGMHISPQATGSKQQHSPCPPTATAQATKVQQRLATQGASKASGLDMAGKPAKKKQKLEHQAGEQRKQAEPVNPQIKEHQKQHLMEQPVKGRRQQHLPEKGHGQDQGALAGSHQGQGRKELKESKGKDGHFGKNGAKAGQAASSTDAAVASVKGMWQFKTDYNDHFETSLQALQDLEPVLRSLCIQLRKEPSALAIYDPYFCRGTIRALYQQLGYTNFVHENRDFYKDIQEGTVPDFDVLVTNPPYSEDHKIRILSFCVGSGRPWALLMPNYVANKQYYTEEVSGGFFGTAKPSASSSPRPAPFYITPKNVKYTYAHPEGTGKDQSPFDSMWFISGATFHKPLLASCKARIQRAAAETETRAKKGSRDKKRPRDKTTPWDVDLADGLEALREIKKVPLGKRLNPKQRARLKAKLGQPQR